jgi:beta-glucanase (GH16 family)
MEMIGGNNRERVVHGTAHWQHGPNKADFGGSFTVPEGNLHDRFHVYSIIWDQNMIRWLINDIQYHQMAITDPELSEFRAPFFFIFNVAVGGNWPGSPNAQTLFPQRMIVDYVRVFQPE